MYINMLSLLQISLHSFPPPHTHTHIIPISGSINCTFPQRNPVPEILEKLGPNLTGHLTSWFYFKSITIMLLDSILKSYSCSLQC